MAGLVNADDKMVSTISDKDRGSGASVQDAPAGPSWSAKDERSLLRKLDFILMPLLVSGFFVLQLDRGNMGNALTDTITTDLNITADDVNLGTQLLFAGIIVAEIPSTLILQRIGAPIWLTFQLAAWGLVSLTQAWCTNKSSFLATRFLLGLCEGGYIPGSQYMLATFYTRQELALRTAIFYFGNYSAVATGSLIAAGVFKMAGINGISGWQWLFILEGTVTLLIFIVFLALLPRSPTHTAPLHGRFDYFSDQERVILEARVIADDETKGAEKANITVKSFFEAISDYRLWLHMILNILSLTPKGSLQLYGPTVIKNLGFSKINANLLNAVSSVLVIFLSYWISFASDKTKLRGPWCIVAFIWSVVFAGALFGLDLDADKWTRYAIFTLLAGGNALSQGLNDSWLSINATSPSKRGVGLAMVVMGANFGGLIGPQLFQAKDAPKYNNGFMAILIFYSACIPVTGLMIWTYWRDNKKARSQVVQRDDEMPAEERRFDI